AATVARAHERLPARERPRPGVRALEEREGAEDERADRGVDADRVEAAEDVPLDLHVEVAVPELAVRLAAAGELVLQAVEREAQRSDKTGELIAPDADRAAGGMERVRGLRGVGHEAAVLAFADVGDAA